MFYTPGHFKNTSEKDDVVQDWKGKRTIQLTEANNTLQNYTQALLNTYF